MCAMTYQENSHSYIFFPDCNVKYKSEQERFGHVQASALSWLDGQKQQTHKLKCIMDGILTVHASRSKIKPWHDLRGETSYERCHLSVGDFLPFQHYGKQISGNISTFGPHCGVNPHLIPTVLWRLCFYPPLPRHLVVGIVVTTDAEVKELAGRSLNLESLDLQGTLKEPVASLQVPVAAPQEMHAADGQEMRGGQPLQEGLELIWMQDEIGARGQITKQRDMEQGKECGDVVNETNVSSCRYCMLQVKNNKLLFSTII